MAATITRRLVSLTDAADILGIGVLDHLILSPTGYFSFKEQQREAPHQGLRARRG